MFFIQILSYGIICINMRAVALGNIPLAASSDFLFASFNFFIIKKIASSKEALHQWVGYALGSVVGSILGILCSDPLLTLIK